MEGNSLMSFENLCKIFEMRIKLDKDNGEKSSRDVFDNYEKYCKKIDTIYNNEFQKELKPLISPAVSLEKEKDRLRRLIKLLEDRLDKRVELEDKFYETTGKYISGLQMIVSDGELEDKRERLSLVSKYLENSDEIQSITDSIIELKKSLEEEQLKKNEYEDKNKILEDELYSSFMEVINSDEYYKNISEDEITNKLEEIRISVSEAKETLDITKESIGTLVNNGLDEDYASYIEEAEKTYYGYKNKEIILKIYKLVIDFEDDFKSICSKRDRITTILNEKKELSESLVIDVDNELLSFEKIVLLQCEVLDNEKDVLDNIINYNNRIKFKEERLEELNESNSSVEILTILREYGLIDTYDTEDVVLEEKNNLVPEIPMIEVPSFEENSVSVEEVYNPYRIVEIIDYPRTLNVGLAKLKGESVREKVNKKLNPKKEEVTTDGIGLDIEDSSLTLAEDYSNTSAGASIGTNEEISSFELNDNSVGASEVLYENSDTLNKSNDLEFGLPVWDLPTDVEPKNINLEITSEQSLPIWEAMNPELDTTKENGHNDEIININILSESEKDNNMFWIPVSDSKLDAKDFSNLNIPISNNLNKNDEFVFPTIND